MQTFFKNYLNLLQYCHNHILEALDGLPPEALDWAPGSDTNSISVLVFHLTGAVRYWIGDVAAQDPTDRDRDAGFRIHNVGMDILKGRLANNLEYARNALDKFTIQDLERDDAPFGDVEVALGVEAALRIDHAAAFDVDACGQHRSRPGSTSPPSAPRCRT